MALGALLLTGCGGGSASESRLAADADATRGNQVPGYESTKVIERFAASPSPSLATRTPLPLLSRLVVTGEIDASGAPGAWIARLTPGQRVYVAIQVARLADGQRLTAVWRDAEGSELGSVAIDVTDANSGSWWVLAWDVPVALPAGDIAVAVYAEDQLLQSVIVRNR